MIKNQLRISLILLMLVIIISGSQSSLIHAAKKEIVVKSYSYCIQSNNYYKISEIAKIKGINGTMNKSQKTKFTNPNIKWTSKSKQVRVKQKKIIVKKSGVYFLKGKLREKKKITRYEIELRAFDKEPTLIPENVSQITIQKLADTITITDPKEISSLREKFNGAEYGFDLKNSNRLITGWNYWIKVYSASGKLVCNFTTLGQSSIRVFQGVTYLSNANNTLQDYVAELFNKYFVTSTSKN